eukprot:symbB.v1.2.000548.t2/scaffold19.1/size443072/12
MMASAARTRRRPVMRGDVSSLREVPGSIPRPPYLAPGQPRQPSDGLPIHPFYSGPEPTQEERFDIEVKDEKDIEGMRAACRLARQTLEVAGRAVAPGVTTDEIDRQAHDFIVANGAYPSPLEYCGFPKAVCTSVNEVVGHGIPDSRPLEDGDFLNIDVTVYLNGYHGDTSCMFFAGRPLKRAVALCKATRKAMLAGIQVCGPGVDFREVGKAITQSATEAGCTVHPTLIGHGIGSYFHGRPEILPYVNDVDQGVMKPGMTFTIEPVLAMFLGKCLICKNSHLPIASPNAMAGDDVTDVIQIYKAAGYQASDLQGLGFPLSALRHAGFTAKEADP